MRIPVVSFAIPSITNIAKLQVLQREIQEKQTEAQQLMQPIMEDQGALKQLEKLSDVVQTVESK